MAKPAGQRKPRGPRPPEDLPRRGAGRRRDRRDAEHPAAAAGGWRRGGRRRRRDPWTQRDARPCSKASRSSRAALSTYNGQTLDEIDIDATLARRPALVAGGRAGRTPTRRAAGTRKRYLDVEEILDARHRRLHHAQRPASREPQRRGGAASPASACARRCPTASLERADEVELVDLTPEDLIQRLEEGKVYVPADGQARRRALFPARQSRRRCANSRCAARAQRVDDQMVDYMRRNAIQGPWAAGERIMVRGSPRLAPGPGPHPFMPQRQADRLRAPWSALLRRNALSDPLRGRRRRGSPSLWLAVPSSAPRRSIPAGSGRGRRITAPCAIFGNVTQDHRRQA